eukprot:scaffold154641_cov19-Tisochrysis_lutea.AAC.1
MMCLTACVTIALTKLFSLPALSFPFINNLKLVIRLHPAPVMCPSARITITLTRFFSLPALSYIFANDLKVIPLHPAPVMCSAARITIAPTKASSVKANDGAEEEKEDGAAMQQPTPDPCSIAPSVSNAPKFLDTASPSAPSQAPAPAVPAPMEESSPAPEGNAQMHLPELPPALMQSKASTSLPPQKAPGPAAASLQPPSQLDQQDHAGVEGM